ncbi:hypothetical protein ACWEU6_00760 [Streptosporangium sandarakinum]|uniref:hypothetical protein n=1 Tax=Streptosporangium sandarakinum TaxID=1260955 RepID=UPI0036B80D1F
MATWRRVRVVPLSAQGMPVTKIAEVTFTGADRVRDGTAQPQVTTARDGSA